MSDKPVGDIPPQNLAKPATQKAWRAETPQSADLADVHAICEAAYDRKADNVVALDLSTISSIADTFVLATGTSDRHVKAIADSVRQATQRLGIRPLGTEGYEEARWILIDFGQTIVHIFQQETREHYDLERLWSDAPQLEIATPDPPHQGERP